MARAHPLELTAPWYRWRRQAEEDGLSPRRSRPVFQKYAAPTFVNRFLTDPQGSYRFMEEDEVHVTEDSPWETDFRSLSQVGRHPTGLRKLFRDTHKRHYLMVCELHCDAPGLPDARLEHTCEMGFVVRRRRPLPVSVPANGTGTEETWELADEKRSVAERIGQVRALIVHIGALLAGREPPDGLRTTDEDLDALPSPPGAWGFWPSGGSGWLFQGGSGSGSGGGLGSGWPFPGGGNSGNGGGLGSGGAQGGLWPFAGPAAWTLYKVRLLEHLARARRELTDLRERHAALGRFARRAWPSWSQDAWIPDAEHENRGEWRPVEDETPEEIEERIHLLCPLIPDPREAEHSSRGARLLFGVVPTDGGETDDRGDPRFRAGEAYEIRAFVRHHRKDCPRRSERADCPGPLVWSPYTEPYAIAAHNDLDGTKNCVVTAEMPDLRELAAQVPTLPPGGGGGVRLTTPDGSALQFQVDGMSASGSGLGGGRMCTFPIPLVTLVATFLFRIFLPIVVFLFRLFFLLPLRICVPPLPQAALASLDGVRDRVQELADAADSPEELAALMDDDEDLRDDVLATLDLAVPHSGPGGESIGDALGECPTSELWEMLQALAGEGAPPSQASLTENLLPEERVEERPRVDRVFSLAGVPE